MKEFTYDFGNKPKKYTRDSLLDAVGKTPLVRFDRFALAADAKANILAKLEYMNPAGSVKDRAALYMIEGAEERGDLTEGGTVIEPTSGNTGIGLAMACAVKGYRLILTMPSNMSEERIKIMKALGAQVVLTDAAAGMQGAVDRANELKAETEGAFIPNQFANTDNIRAHIETTGPEILRDTYGHADIFVAGVGSGGTVTGVGRVLKALNKKTYVVAVEPAESPVLKGGPAGSHGIEGIGANFIPDNFDRGIVDEIFDVSKDEAYAAVRAAARTEGALLGISSGAALHAAAQIGRRPENQGKNIVVLLPDGGDKYLSTDLFI